MSVAKTIEISAESTTGFDDAVKAGIASQRDRPQHRRRLHKGAEGAGLGRRGVGLPGAHAGDLHARLTVGRA